MMYIAGETQDASIETLAMIEDIIRQQVIHLVRPTHIPLLFHGCVLLYSYT